MTRSPWRMMIWAAALMVAAIPVHRSLCAADYSFTVDVNDPIVIAPMDSVTILKSVITNTGNLTDTLDVTMQFETPDTSWFVIMCVGSSCYPPGILQAPLHLEPQQTDSATIDITPMNVEGGATASLTFQSRGDPTQVETVYFALITEGTDVLIVDGDGGSGYESYYQDAVPDSYSKGLWDLQLEPVTAEELSNFDFCFWLTGERVPALTTGEMQALSTYLDGGGKLFISGQDIGRDIGGTTFYSDYLHADFVADSTGILSLDGIDGEPISDGLTIDISGGDGANNQVRPSEVSPLPVVNGVAYTSFYYAGTQRSGAVSSVSYNPADTSRVAYFAFGFEAVSNKVDRRTIGQRVLEFLAGIRVGIGCDGTCTPGEPGIPVASTLRQNYPNPFNPTTTIGFATAGAAHVGLKVYDIRGRLVRTMIDRDLPAGEHAAVWDGRDNRGRRVGSGSYLYRLSVNGHMRTRRMVVAK